MPSGSPSRNVSTSGPSDATCRTTATAGSAASAGGSGPSGRTSSGSAPIVGSATDRARRLRRSRRTAAIGLGRDRRPAPGTHRTTTFVVAPHGLRSAPGPAMSTIESGSSSAPPTPAARASRRRVSTATPARRWNAVRPALDAVGSTTSRTFEMRTESPGRTTSTVASASAGCEPAPTASCGSASVRRPSLHPVWVPSTTSSTANVAISRSASVDAKLSTVYTLAANQATRPPKSTSRRSEMMRRQETPSFSAAIVVPWTRLAIFWKATSRA